jgi:plastocyanin
MLVVAGVFNYLIGKQTDPQVANHSDTNTAKSLMPNSNSAPPAPRESKAPVSDGAKVSGDGSVATKTVPEKKFSDGNDLETLAPDVLVVQVDFDGEKFSPASVNLKVGDFVIFKNNSKNLLWPASDPHPAHSGYPDFDSKQAIQAGGKWQFQFKKSGEWKYHNHLNPSLTGVVVVK